MRCLVLMHQLRVFRCDICQAPFLFESSLEDHKNVDHAPKEVKTVKVNKRKKISRSKKQKKA